MRLTVKMLLPILSIPIVGYRDCIVQRLLDYFTIFEFEIQRNEQTASFEKQHDPCSEKGDLLLLHSPLFSREQTFKRKRFCTGFHSVKKLINQFESVPQGAKNQRQQIAHDGRIKPFTPPDQRLCRKSCAKLVETSSQSIATETDDDLVLVHLSEREGFTSLQNAINTPSSATPTPSAYLSENNSIQNSQQFPQDSIELLLIMHAIQDPSFQLILTPTVILSDLFR